MSSFWGWRTGVQAGTAHGFPGAFPAGTQRIATTTNFWTFASGLGRVEALERYGILAARILMGQIFLVSGLMKIVNWSGTEAEMASRGMFWIPFFHVAALTTELVCGLSLLLGYKARLGALLLILFLIPVTFTFHNFWTYTTPKDQQINMFSFMHNFALMGGLLLLVVQGPGPWSLDWKRRARARQ